MHDPIIVGFDAGNSEANLVIGTGRRQKTLTIPSVIGTGNSAELADKRGGSGRGGSGLKEDEYVLESGHGSWFVGKLALAQTTDATSQRGNISRYWNGHSLRLLQVLAGTLISARKFTIRVVTGLPVQVWNDHTAGEVAGALNGTHRFTLNGVEREMTVDGVCVIMEGAGALIAYGSADDVPQGVIDVGGQTTDLFYAIGQEPQIQRCKGVDRGVESVSDHLRDTVGRAIRPLQAHELRSVLHAYAHGETIPTLYNDGQPFILNGELRDALAMTADAIRTFVAQTWRSNDTGRVAQDAQAILLIGGGAYYFQPALKKLLPHLVVPPQPELANARGYRDLGDALGDDDWSR